MNNSSLFFFNILTKLPYMNAGVQLHLLFLYDSSLEDIYYMRDVAGLITPRELTYIISVS